MATHGTVYCWGTNKILGMLQLQKLCYAEDADGIFLQKQLTNYKV